MREMAAHYCSCGTRLANDNHTGRCGACRRKDRHRLERPPTVPCEFWDHVEVRAALASRHFGRVLRAYRCHPFHGVRPLAQDVVSRWLGLTQPQLSRTENGPAVRNLDRLVVWAMLLGVPEHLLWFRLPADPPSGEPSRRPPRARIHRPAVASLPQQKVGIGVDDLAAMQSLRTADRQLGGGYLYATVATYLQRQVAPRLFGSDADNDGQQVFVAAAGLTEMAGWMAHDAGRDALAEQHFQRALGMAQIAGDHQLGAHIFGSLSHLAHHQRRPEQAVRYARDGQTRLSAGAPHPGVTARLLAMQARGHAALRDGARCQGDLRQAERVLATQPADPSPWVSAFDEASLAAEAARCFQQLGQLNIARRQAEQVVELRPRDRARSRAFGQLMLISILIAQGRPDEACGAAYEVLDGTRALGSYLVVQQLEQLNRLLAPYRRTRDVAHLLDHLEAELRERRWLAQWLPTTDGSQGQAQSGT
jgi:hypothetical protein